MSLLDYAFFQRALLAIVAMSLFSPAIGVFLILRRQSLMSDTLSHISLAGVALGLLLGLSPTWMTLVVVVIAAVFLEYLRTVYASYLEVGTVILMAAGLAIAMVVMSKSGGGQTMSLEQYLYGSIVTISWEQVLGLFAIAAVVLFFLILAYRPLYLLTFDEDTAQVDGIPTRALSIAFNVMSGVAIALMIPAAGALLVSTIMILPASIALRLGRHFRSVLWLSCLIGLIGMVAGLFLSYYWESPASASITLIFITIFMVVALLKRK
ncbi:metal ABC transporter permease [Streptococcus sp. 121]|uniref:metal ABC transporter permease n=1 Tax=Streptococcus sp. 121 TaxID=2797637 RepID=UPI0018F1054E|nr:iron chelate uptake ABC transporter family permease subunit [Streptococcus sp. 121]MBJ6745882.1 metal ABC transporter permease [Streptococcus sp. 121]